MINDKMDDPFRIWHLSSLQFGMSDGADSELLTFKMIEDTQKGILT